MKTKKSKKIRLILLGSIAAGIVAACSPTQSRACVDREGVVVDSSYCDNRGSSVPYFWYYGGYYGGGRAYGGSFEPSRGANYNTATPNIARGGLGTTASGGKSSVSS